MAPNLGGDGIAPTQGRCADAIYQDIYASGFGNETAHKLCRIFLQSRASR